MVSYTWSINKTDIYQLCADTDCLKTTYEEQWPIGTDGKCKSKETILLPRSDDDEDLFAIQRGLQSGWLKPYTDAKLNCNLQQNNSLNWVQNGIEIWIMLINLPVDGLFGEHLINYCFKQYKMDCFVIIHYAHS